MSAGLPPSHDCEAPPLSEVADKRADGSPLEPVISVGEYQCERMLGQLLRQLQAMAAARQGLDDGRGADLLLALVGRLERVLSGNGHLPSAQVRLFCAELKSMAEGRRQEPAVMDVLEHVCHRTKQIFPTFGCDCLSAPSSDERRKRSALIRELEPIWPTIKDDLRHSDTSDINGLHQAAKLPGHGWWNKAAALEWAKERGKLMPSHVPEFDQRLMDPIEAFNRRGLRKPSR